MDDEDRICARGRPKSAVDQLLELTAPDRGRREVALMQSAFLSLSLYSSLYLYLSFGELIFMDLRFGLLYL